MSVVQTKAYCKKCSGSGFKAMTPHNGEQVGKQVYLTCTKCGHRKLLKGGR